LFIYYAYSFLLMLYIKSALNREVITLFVMTFLFKDFICESEKVLAFKAYVINVFFQNIYS